MISYKNLLQVVSILWPFLFIVGSSVYTNRLLNNKIGSPSIKKKYKSNINDNISWILKGVILGVTSLGSGHIHNDYVPDWVYTVSLVLSLSLSVACSYHMYLIISKLRRMPNIQEISTTDNDEKR